jgi:hypothetical protein
MSKATQQDAELILKLYDLRREPVMREARNFFATFTPSSFEELMAVMGNFGSKENAYVRQVMSYWEMAASLIVHGALNAELAQDTLGEMNFVYAKMQPFIAQMRQMMKSPEFLQNIEKVVEGTPEGRERFKHVQARMAEFAKMQAAHAAKHTAA